MKKLGLSLFILCSATSARAMDIQLRTQEVENRIKACQSWQDIVPFLPGTDIQKVLLCAAFHGDGTIFNLLLENGVMPTIETYGLVMYYNQLPQLLRFIAHGTDINTRVGTQKLTALIHTAKSSSLSDDRINDLLLAGANPNLQDSSGKTALIHATLNNKCCAVTHLIHYGANPLLKDSQGKSALDYAQDLGLDNRLGLFHARPEWISSLRCGGANNNEITTRSPLFALRGLRSVHGITGASALGRYQYRLRPAQTCAI